MINTTHSLSHFGISFLLAGYFAISLNLMQPGLITKTPSYIFLSVAIVLFLLSVALRPAHND